MHVPKWEILHPTDKDYLPIYMFLTCSPWFLVHMKSINNIDIHILSWNRYTLTWDPRIMMTWSSSSQNGMLNDAQEEAGGWGGHGTHYQAHVSQPLKGCKLRGIDGWEDAGSGVANRGGTRRPRRSFMCNIRGKMAKGPNHRLPKNSLGRIKQEHGFLSRGPTTSHQAQPTQFIPWE